MSSVRLSITKEKAMTLLWQIDISLINQEELFECYSADDTFNRGSTRKTIDDLRSVKNSLIKKLKESK